MQHTLLTAERQKTHGNFAENALISQNLKNVFHSLPGWQNLNNEQKEAVEMMCMKFSRIFSGKSDERQHWEDVEGYAHLATESCDTID